MFDSIPPEIVVSIGGKPAKEMLLHILKGMEAISRPFDFTLTFVSRNTTFDCKGSIGKPLAISFTLPQKERVFHGIITEFTQGITVKVQNLPLTEYKVRLRPNLYLLSLGSDYKIYQQKSVIDIVKSVLKENGVTEVKDKTQKSGRAVRSHCVQYGETFFDFFSRLCEEEGISYHFQHTAQGHTLILTDAPSAFSAISGEQEVPFIQTFLEKPPFHKILSCSVCDSLVPKGYEARDYNYEIPKTELNARVQGKGQGGTFIEYPGHFANVNEGTQLTNIRIQELEFPAHLVEGESTAMTFTAGASFSLKGHPRTDVNTAYTLAHVEHDFTIESLDEAQTPIYKNYFRGFPKSIPIRPARKTRKNLIHGAQTAIVTGPENAEIHRGPYGAVKVHFLWDRHGKKDDSSSWWIRSMQSLASHQYGGVIIPRVGDEVLIVFAEGDPEKPLIVGSVYNGENTPPYPEKEATKSGFKTHSSPQAKGYNEWYFDDDAGKEKGHLFLQKDGEAFISDSLKMIIDKGNEERNYQEGSRITKLEAKGNKEGNDTLHLTKGMFKIQIDKGNYNVTLGEGNAKFAISGATDWQVDKSHTAVVKENATVTVKGDLTVKVTGKVLIQGEDDITLKAGKNMIIQAGQNLTLKAGQNATLQSGQDTTVHAGKNLKQAASMNVEVTASMNYTAKASMAYKAEGQLNAEIKAGVQLKLGGTTIENQAQALFKVNAPMSMIGGGMVKLG
ncbi:MAG: type VI secretion system tip protein VgrG [Holosporales bacterium]|jgi:type VI secretion system secreted protein VgrG|nr:type VI secretion system tip protein VgrG [Holosporales bacterium]